jgi:peptidoglycan/LPS O-acetylase OafA/YrhL
MPDATAQANRYRPDIDGMRAIAVLAVILFHLDRNALPGGFIGVDIFFVISGFLITRNIVTELHYGKFTIVDFYRRRVKRIAPAMLLVVAATLGVAEILLLPEDARDTAKSAFASVASLANVYFWLYRDSGYFAPASSSLPLLHLWSLGVEEQFYLLWPAILAATFRPSRFRGFIVVAAAVAVISFALADILFPRDPSFVYYMLPTRAGELLLGSIGAVATLYRLDERIPGWCASTFVIFGLVAIALSLALITEDVPFPGRYAVPSTLGAVLAIVGAGHRPTDRLVSVLSSRPLVAIGLVSYSAYLWHWPLIAIYSYGYGHINMLAGILIVVVTFVLAALTYKFVEQPARNKRWPATKVFVVQLAIPGAVVALLSIALVYQSRIGIPWPTPTYLTELASIRKSLRPAFMFDRVCQRQRIATADLKNPNCVLGDTQVEEPRAILFGDSNAAHYVGMIEAFANHGGFRFRNVEIGSCPPLARDPAPFVSARREVDCRASLARVLPVVDRFPVVIVSSSWSSYASRSEAFLPAFFEMANALAAKGKLVIIIGKVPPIAGYDRRCREKALRFPNLDCENPAVPVDPAIAKINAQLSQFASHHVNIRYFDATAFLCPDNRCRAYADNGAPRYFDTEHLTMAESDELGAAIVRTVGVPLAFADIARWPDTRPVRGDKADRP